MKHESHTRTDCLKPSEGSAVFLDEQLLQYTRPQHRQWCLRRVLSNLLLHPRQTVTNLSGTHVILRDLSWELRMSCRV